MNRVIVEKNSIQADKWPEKFIIIKGMVSCAVNKS